MNININEILEKIKPRQIDNCEICDKDISDKPTYIKICNECAKKEIEDNK